MITGLTRVEALKLLEKCRFGHLGCVLGDGEPYVLPVNYLFIGGDIYVHSLPGKKLNAMRENHKICLQVEEFDKAFGWSSAIVFGDFQEIKTEKETFSVLQEFNRQFERLTPVEAMSIEEWNAGKVIVFRIHVRKITGMAEIEMKSEDIENIV